MTLNIVIGVADTCTPPPSVYEVCIDEWEWDFVSKNNGIWNILQQIVGISGGGGFTSGGGISSPEVACLTSDHRVAVGTHSIISFNCTMCLLGPA